MDREEAIKNVRSFIGQLTEDCQESIRVLVPELAESEDERIRKWIVNLVMETGKNHSNPKLSENVKSALAWLEKQKEHLPIPDKFSGLKSLMLQYLQSAANRKDDTEIESDTDLFGRKILDYVWKYSDEQKEQKPAEYEIEGRTARRIRKLNP